MISLGYRIFQIALVMFWVMQTTLSAQVSSEVVEAEKKYADGVVKALGSSKGDKDAREKLVALNRYFVTHLKKIQPGILAQDRAQATLISQRIRGMEGKLDPGMELTLLDGRASTLAPEAKHERPAAVAPDSVGSKPSGELESRQDGEEIAIGDVVEIRGRTKNIPDGNVVQVFGVPNWSGMFPLENRKDPDRRFLFRQISSESWLGPVSFVLITYPKELAAEVEAWHLARKRWAEAEFATNMVPVLRGAPCKNLYSDTLLKLGGIQLAELKVEFVR